MTLFPGEFVQFYPLGRFDDPVNVRQRKSINFKGSSFASVRMSRFILLIHTVEADELEVVAFEAARERVFQIVQNRAA